MRRSREVAGVLTGHGLGTVVDQMGLRRFAPFRVRQPEHRPIRQAEHLRLALGELGVTFTKLGQMLSTRADLLPPEYVHELSMLQDSAPRVPAAEIRRVIREELGAEAEERFASFDDVPIASASIGQVHGARLQDGRDVVVKVQRPCVADQIEVDLGIMRGVADWMQVHTAFGRDYDLRPLVEEFAHSLHGELDYVREGQSADRFRRAMADEPRLWIPLIHWDLTTRRVLTMERVTGIKVTDIEGLERLGVSRRHIAETAVRTFIRQVLEHGFFHADPHPGNFFVQPDGTVAVVDFGMTGRVSEITQMRLLRAGLAAIREDAEALAEEMYALGVAGRRADRAAFQRDLDHLLGHYGGRSLRELSATVVVREFTDIAFRHRLQLPGELALLFRVVIMSEGLGLTVDPDFHYLDYASPFFQERWNRYHGLTSTARRVGRAAVDAAELGLELPRRAAMLLGRLERGELELNVRHEGLDRFSNQLQVMFNRLALAVILAASVVAMALALGVRAFPGGAAYLSWLFKIGLVFSLVFGAALLWSMWRAPKR
jgi:ubiquinone biosynthesis protein